MVRSKERTHVTDKSHGQGAGPDRRREYPGAPRWVKLTGIVVIGLVVLVLLVLAVTSALGLHDPGGPGGHGPGSGRLPSEVACLVSGACQKARRTSLRGDLASPRVHSGTSELVLQQTGV